jgi:hypothetical protein
MGLLPLLCLCLLLEIYSFQSPSIVTLLRQNCDRFITGCGYTFHITSVHYEKG